MISTAQIQQMSATERLETMELLWKAISHRPEEVQSPAWHQQVLAERTAKIERGEAVFLTINQLKERLKK
jgi:hypothetical protein